MDRKKPDHKKVATPPKEYAVIHRKRLSIKPTYTDAWNALRRLVDSRKIHYESCKAALDSGEYVIEPPKPELPIGAR